MDPRTFAWEFQYNAEEEEKEELAVGPVALARPNFCFGGNPARVLITPLQTAAMAPSATSTSTSTYRTYTLNPRNQVPFEYLPREHGFAIPGSPAESDLLYQQYARSRGIPPGSAEERDLFSSPRCRRSSVLRRSTRLQQQALQSEDQMPGIDHAT